MNSTCLDKPGLISSGVPGRILLEAERLGASGLLTFRKGASAYRVHLLHGNITGLAVLPRRNRLENRAQTLMKLVEVLNWATGSYDYHPLPPAEGKPYELWLLLKAANRLSGKEPVESLDCLPDATQILLVNEWALAPLLKYGEVLDTVGRIGKMTQLADFRGSPGSEVTDAGSPSSDVSQEVLFTLHGLGLLRFELPATRKTTSSSLSPYRLWQALREQQPSAQ